MGFHIERLGVYMGSASPDLSAAKVTLLAALLVVIFAIVMGWCLLTAS